MSYSQSAFYPDVSVVIPTKNGGLLFLEVLQKLKSQVYEGSIELLVVDSGSSDDTLKYAQQYCSLVTSIPAESFNHGETRNLGISLAKGEVIVLMTQDAVPANSFLISKLVEGFSKAEHVGGVYARQIPRPEADVLTKRNLNSWLTGRTDLEVREWIGERAYSAMTPMEKYIFCNFDNVCAAITREAWQEVPFNVSNFGEDIEWCLGALKRSWKIVYQPEAAVIHSHDRPIAYEYKRTYVCHRKLYALFYLVCIPTWRQVLRSLFSATMDDCFYVLFHEKDFREKIKLLLKVPALNIASVLGQYRGARDESQKRGKTFREV
ncbi:MAG TPA: glycosyltransferase [Phormidium sp.]